MPENKAWPPSACQGSGQSHTAKRGRQAPQAVAELFRPNSVVVVGASSDPSRYGGKIIPSMLRQGFTGKIYPVNPGRSEISGLPCYRDLASVPGQIDCLVYAIGADLLLPMLEEIAHKGTRLLFVASAGFAERGDDEGRERQAQLVSFARAHGIRVLGPNCIGFANFSARACVSSAAMLEWPDLPAGNVSLVSQSGGLGLGTLLYTAHEQGLGFSTIVTTGNDADLDTIDIARGFVSDPATDVIAMTIEAVSDPGDFIELLHLAGTAGKPVIVLKSGRTELGKDMAASHTGALTGSAALFDALCDQYGVICAHDTDDFCELAAMFAKLKAADKLKLAASPAAHCAALSISGGHIGLFADHGSLRELKFPAFAPETNAAISRELGFEGNFQNPLDTTARTIGDDGFWGRVTKVLLNDPGVKVVIPIITIAHSYDAAIDDFIRLAEASDKIVIVLWAGGSYAGSERGRLQASNVPLFRTAARAAAGIAELDRYCRFWNRPGANSERRQPSPDQSLTAACALLAKRHRQGRRTLTERESKEILTTLGFRTTRERSVSTVEAAVAAGRDIGYPLVVKGEHPAILHKSEAGIVHVGIADEATLRLAYDSIVARMEMAVPGGPSGNILIQELVRGDVELIAGVTTDPEFGPVVVFGLGGIFVEILNDVSMRIPPFDHNEALRMLDQIKGAQMLDGIRGRQCVDRDKLASLLVRLGDFAAMSRHFVKEIDINPLIAIKGGAGELCVVDGLFVLHEPPLAPATEFAIPMKEAKHGS